MNTQSIIVKQAAVHNHEITFMTISSSMFNMAKRAIERLNKKLEIYGSAAAAAIRN
ncbi:MAG: UV DNA damage repair endonuclease [Dokdonia sp.]|jgi:UV DNA damage repair endonuclease